MAIEDIALPTIIFSFIFIGLHLFIGIKIILKYFSDPKKELISVGFTWIFLSMIWWGVPLYMISVLLMTKFPDALYLTVGLGMLMIALMFWIISVSSLILPKNKKKIILVFGVICISYESFFFIFLFLNQEIIGYVIGGFYFYPSLITLIALFFMGIIGFIFTILLTKELLKADDPKVKLKAKFIILAFISLIIGGIFEIFLPLELITFVLARSVLLIAAILYYLGFFLPDRIANLFIKK